MSLQLDSTDRIQLTAHEPSTVFTVFVGFAAGEFILRRDGAAVGDTLARAALPLEPFFGDTR